MNDHHQPLGGAEVTGGEQEYGHDIVSCSINHMPLTVLATSVRDPALPGSNICRLPRSGTHALTHLFSLETAPSWADSACAGASEPEGWLCALVSRSAAFSCAAMASGTGKALAV